MKKLICLIMVFTLLITSSNVYAYDDNELQRALEDAELLPEQLSYAIDFEHVKHSTLSVTKYNGAETDKGIIRVFALEYLMKAIGMNHYDMKEYSQIRFLSTRAYEDKYPFNDLGAYDYAVHMAYELGIVYGDGKGQFRSEDLLTCLEAVGLVMRCIYDNDERDLNVLYGKAKEIGIVKDGDKFYNEPESIIEAEEWLILLYRMKQHSLVVAPVTNELTKKYIFYSGRGPTKDYELETEWKTKPLRRAFLYPELVAKYSFDGLSKDDVIGLLGNYDASVSNDKISYRTYVLESLIDEVGKDFSTYANGTIEFCLNEDGNVIGEPKVVKGSGGFSQLHDMTDRSNAIIQIEFFE